MLIGVQTEVRDYIGSKTLYMHNALTAAGISTVIYDKDSTLDPPPGVTHSIFLPWIQYFDSDWADFFKSFRARQILYTDNYNWFTQCNKNLLQAKKVDMEEAFNVIAFASSEGMRWWPKGRFSYWGGLVDEDVAVAKPPEDYIYIDQIWPNEWAKGQWNADKVIELAAKEIKARTGLALVTQQADAKKSEFSKVNTEWADQFVDDRVDIEHMLSVIAGARAFVTSHEEALGMMQLEALTCGVPVVTNANFSKLEITNKVTDGIFTWDWPKKADVENSTSEEPINYEECAESLVSAITNALDNSDRQAIRDQAIVAFGKEAFIERTGLLLD